ncbi:MAG: 2-aminoethylphosphonate-pyruvate transaminase [Candidatus Poriferisodalaceae bacterium]|jgi:2-aminoethylphosphonate-pyruvate transaminase
MKKLLLFTPGPVNVADNVRASAVREDICHREIEFEDLFRSLETRLLKLFEIRQPKLYQAVVLTGSGSAANEAMLSSVVGDQNILVLSNGEFGERLHATSKIHNANTFELKFPWGSALDLATIDAFLRVHRIDVIAAAHHETSSGMLNPLAALGALAKAHDAILLVDCVSSAGAEAIDMERDNIAFCSASSSKAIGAYPGLSFVIGKRTEFEKLSFLTPKTGYLNLFKFFEFATQRSQTPNTPAVPLFFALDEALSNILIETVAGRRAKILRTATRLRTGMTKLGLTFLLDVKDMSSVLTTVNLPANVDIAQLRKSLRDQSIIIYEGKGPLTGRVFQVGSIGELAKPEVKRFLRALRDALPAVTLVEPIIRLDPPQMPDSLLASA